PMGLEVGLLQYASDLTGADTTHQTSRYHRCTQALVRPGIAREAKILRRPARRSDDLVTFERGDLDRAPRTGTVLEAHQSPLLEAAYPLTDPQPAGTEVSRD